MYLRWFFSLVGWLILRLKYNSEEERQYILNKKYDGHYSTVGAEYPLKLVAIIFMIALFMLLIAVIYSIFEHGPAPV